MICLLYVLLMRISCREREGVKSVMRLATDDRQVLIEKAVVYGWSEHIGLHALVSAANSLMAAGASDIGIGVRITYPPHSDKSKSIQWKKQ